MFGRERFFGASVRAAAFLGLSYWLNAEWFRGVQTSGFVVHQDPSSPVLHLAPYALDKVGPVGIAIALTVVIARLDRRSADWCGVPFTFAAVSRFGQGAATAIASFCLVMTIIAAMGGYSVQGLAQHGLRAIGYATAWTVLFGMVAVQEELVFRGYALMTLRGSFGFWPAAILTSCYFGYSHAGNAFEDWQSELLLALFALSGCLVRKMTGSLWFLIGFHMLWDYTESIIFSVPDSGLLSVGRLLDAHLLGNPFLTGGSVGPEASPVTVAVDVLVLAAIILAFRNQTPPRERQIM